jgi:hypothetical protein
MNGQDNMVKMLMAHGCNPNLADDEGTTPVEHLAKYKSRVRGVRIEEVLPHVYEFVSDIRDVIDEYVNEVVPPKIDKENERKQAEKNANKNKKKNERKKKAKRRVEKAHRAENRSDYSFDCDSDDEGDEIERCQCADCLALDAK